MKRTITVENYLKAIFHLCKDNSTFTINELSLVLHLKMPTIHSMMKKFAEYKWVIFESYKPLKLTESGKKQAALVVRKHRLTEMFLVEKMNFGWENVHEIAEQLEHVQSELFFNKMDEILEFPKFDPHGEPIPDKNGQIIEQDLLKLTQCNEGDLVILKSVTYADQALLEYLTKREITLGTILEIISIEKYDSTFYVKYNEKRIYLSALVAEKLLVKKSNI